MSAVQPPPAASEPPAKPGRAGVIAIYAFLAAQIGRTLADDGVTRWLPAYLGLMLLFTLGFTLTLWRPPRRAWLMHAYLAAQAALVTAMLALNPDMDFVNAFLLPLSYQLPFVFDGRRLWLWAAALTALTILPLMFWLGALRGLALGLTTATSCLVLPAYLVVSREIEAARLRSEALLEELQRANRRLREYAGQVEELAAIEERNRLARALHDSVSQQIFSITLTARSAQLLLQKDPALAREPLTQLQEMTRSALAELRSLIAQLQPGTY
jgi:signal transduction histidine kinase